MDLFQSRCSSRTASDDSRQWCANLDEWRAKTKLRGEERKSTAPRCSQAVSHLTSVIGREPVLSNVAVDVERGKPSLYTYQVAYRHNERSKFNLEGARACSTPRSHRNSSSSIGMLVEIGRPARRCDGTSAYLPVEESFYDFLA